MVYAHNMKKMSEGLMRGGDISTARVITRFILGFGLIAAILFGTAGTFNWPEAWTYIIVQFTYSLRMTLWLKKHDPQLLKSRMRVLNPSMQQRDKLFALLFTLLFIPFLLLPGLDAIRFGWSDMPLAIEIIGFAGVSWALWLILRVMQENSFASPIVEIQRERNHQVIDSGPYAYVRHPMYTGFITMNICLPLALGSLWTLPVGLLLSSIFLIRIRFEEQTLQDELQGYSDYCQRVSYRLVPGVW